MSTCGGRRCAPKLFTPRKPPSLLAEAECIPLSVDLFIEVNKGCSGFVSLRSSL